MSPNLVLRVRSRRLRRAGHLAHMGRKKYVQNLDGKTYCKIPSWKAEKKMR
jgi:hypothetical protein